MSDLQQTLRELHRELAEAQRLDPQDRVLLESTLKDIQLALETTPAPGAPSDATNMDTGGGVLAAAVVRLEAGHPGLAAAVRSVMASLAQAGI
jgi:hypothetical protein